MPNRTLTTKRKIMEKKHRAERKQKAKEERGKYLPKFRFMAMSKLIGVIDGMITENYFDIFMV